MNKKIGTIVLTLGIIAIIAGFAYFYINNPNSDLKEIEKDETNSVDNKTKEISIPSCSKCKFMYLPNTDMWTSWNTENKIPTKITEKLSNNYLEITKSSGKRYFLGVKLNDENEIVNIYGCGIQDEVPFCIEATKDGLKYENNKKVLKNKVWNDFYKIEKDSENGIEYEVTYCPPSVEILGVQTFSEGTVKIGDDNFNFCVIRSNGYARCIELK